MGDINETLSYSSSNNLFNNSSIASFNSSNKSYCNSYDGSKSLSSFTLPSVPSLDERNNNNNRSRDEIYNSAVLRAKQRQESKKNKSQKNRSNNTKDRYQQHDENTLSAYLANQSCNFESDVETDDEDKSILSNIFRKVEKIYD